MGLFNFLKELFAPVDNGSKTKEEERVRARGKNGRFVADDPSTPDNEAYTKVKKAKSKKVKKARKGRKGQKGNAFVSLASRFLLSGASYNYISRRHDI